MTEGAIVENQPERVESFTQEIESLKLKASSAENEKLYGALLEQMKQADSCSSAYWPSWPGSPWPSWAGSR